RGGAVVGGGRVASVGRGGGDDRPSPSAGYIVARGACFEANLDRRDRGSRPACALGWPNGRRERNPRADGRGRRGRGEGKALAKGLRGRYKGTDSVGVCHRKSIACEESRRAVPSKSVRCVVPRRCVHGVSP